MSEIEEEVQSDQPEPVPGPLRDIQLQFDRLKTDVEYLEAHIKSSLELYHALVEDMKMLWPRLEKVERKTFALADRPAQKNCPHCGKKLQNPKASRCGLCGKDIYQ